VKSTYKFVAAQRDSYRSDTIEITEGYEFSQYETLLTIELYDNDRFLTGNKDDLYRRVGAFEPLVEPHEFFFVKPARSQRPFAQSV
jgi:hypothetical protein